MERWCIRVNFDWMKPPAGRGCERYARTHGKEGSCLLISTSMRRRRLSSDAPRITVRRATAAAAPRPARPMPPAKRGLLKRASRGRIEDATDVEGGGVVMESFGKSN